MKYLIKYRIPDDEHITFNLEGVDHILTLDEYINVIKYASRVPGSGLDYIEARNKLVVEYINNGPKEQFSW